MALGSDGDSYKAQIDPAAPCDLATGRKRESGKCQIGFRPSGASGSWAPGRGHSPFLAHGRRPPNAKAASPSRPPRLSAGALGTAVRRGVVRLTRTRRGAAKSAQFPARGSARCLMCPLLSGKKLRPKLCTPSIRGSSHARPRFAGTPATARCKLPVAPSAQPSGAAWRGARREPFAICRFRVPAWMPWNYRDTLARLATPPPRNMMKSCLAGKDRLQLGGSVPQIWPENGLLRSQNLIGFWPGTESGGKCFVPGSMPEAHF